MTSYDSALGPIRLADPIKGGGEATVYKIRGQSNYVAKIYRAYHPDYEPKLAWMKSNPPHDPTRASGQVSIAWPVELLYDHQGRLAGFIMSYVRNAVPLLSVFNPRERSQTLPNFDWKYLHRTARNLAIILGAVHDYGYVVGDLNESNIMVDPSAMVTIIDTDSFQVHEHTAKGVRLYRCPVGKLEYLPPELQGSSFGQIVRRPEHDRFGLGVLIFQLLMNGSHPFRSIWLASSEPPSIEEKIRRGCFPYAKTTLCPVAPPPNAPTLDMLHPRLADLMRLCFVDGHRNPTQRPTPGMWELALREAEQTLTQCSNKHYYSAHLKSCPYCSQNVRVSVPAIGTKPGPPPSANWPLRGSPTPPVGVRQKPVITRRPIARRTLFITAAVGFLALLFVYPPVLRSWRMANLCTTTVVSVDGSDVLVQDTARWTGVGLWLSVWVSINGQEYYEYALRDEHVFQASAPIREVTLTGVRVVDGPLGGPPDQYCNTFVYYPTSTPAPAVATSAGVSTLTQQTANSAASLGTIVLATTAVRSESVIGRVIGDQWVNVRSGPGTSYPPLSSIRPGTSLPVLGKSEDEKWLWVQLEDARHGWMTATLVDLGGQQVSVVPSTGSQTTIQATNTLLPTCGGVQSRFRRGETAVVDFNQLNALRILTDYHGGASQTVAQAYDNERFILNEGPVCYRNQWYWNATLVRSSGLYTGWVAETDTAGRPYLCPLANRECR